MKTRYFSLLTIVLVMASVVAAQTRAVAPNIVVKNLYAAHASKSGPFFQSKSRARINKFFAKELGDMLWRDAADANGEVGTLNFDPLYNAQDTEITRFKIGAPMYGEGNLHLADVPVTFRNFGKEETILFRLERTGKGKPWLITNISYPSINSSLVQMFTESEDPGSMQTEGKLHIGKTISHILYFGNESGDYAAYCFANDSAMGKAILDACKDGEQCVVTGEIGEGDCKAEGLEADLSSWGVFKSVRAVRSLGKQN